MPEYKRVYRKKLRGAALVALTDLAVGITIPVDDPQNRDYLLYLTVVRDGNAVVLEPDDPLPDANEVVVTPIQPTYRLTLPATDTEAQVGSMKPSYINRK